TARDGMRTGRPPPHRVNEINAEVGALRFNASSAKVFVRRLLDGASHVLEGRMLSDSRAATRHHLSQELSGSLNRGGNLRVHSTGASGCMVVRACRKSSPAVKVATNGQAVLLRPSAQDLSVYALDQVFEVVTDASVQKAVDPLEHWENEQQLLERVGGEVPARGEERVRGSVGYVLLAKVVHELIDVAPPFL